MSTRKPSVDEAPVEKALLFGYNLENERFDASASVAELAALAHSAGVEVVDVLVQHDLHPTPRTLVSAYQVTKIKEAAEAAGATMVIFDGELKGSQRRNLEGDLGKPVVDRTEVILDIFAQRATTRDGKTQVELAQLLYEMPRLRTGDIFVAIGALGGGIGTRGPGETQLELDRRRIRTRIAVLKRELAKMTAVRETQRKSRRGGGPPVVALVGYTNAGKSTLMRRLTGAEAYADDRLFATLDPLTRRGYVAAMGREVLFTDTVGFIARLPTTLVEAFKSTLEEATLADLLLVVVDRSDMEYAEKERVVMATLTEIGAGEIPMVVVYNKIDSAPESPTEAREGAVYVSAVSGEGIPSLEEALAGALGAGYPHKRL